MCRDKEKQKTLPELPSEVDGIIIPNPVTEEEFPDSTFQESHQNYAEFREKAKNTGHLPPTTITMSLQEYAASARAITIPLQRWDANWKQTKYDGRSLWSQLDLDTKRNMVERILRERLLRSI